MANRRAFYHPIRRNAIWLMTLISCYHNAMDAGAAVAILVVGLVIGFAWFVAWDYRRTWKPDYTKIAPAIEQRLSALMSNPMPKGGSWYKD